MPAIGATGATRSITTSSAGGSANAAANPNPLAQPSQLPAVTSAQAAAIDKVLANTPMRGTGKTFVSAGNQYDISPWFLVAIAGHESGFGSAGFATNGSHNPFGLGVTGAPGAGFRYGSWDAAIRAAAANLGGPLYKGAGKITIKDIGSRWAADPNWADAVATKMASLTGAANDKDTVVIGPRRSLPNDKVSDNSLADSLKEINPISSIADVLKFIADPKTWIRIGSMILGAAAMFAGVFMLVKSGDAGRPIGLIIMSLGFVWLYAAVKAINPTDLVKQVVGA